MKFLPLSAAVVALLLMSNGTASAQKQGGTLRVYHRDSPASMSIDEETTLSTSMPMMGVFNNLIAFDPHENRNRLDNIVPELAESWSLSEDGRGITFKLRGGVNWHDGKPFTANDIKCSWDLLLGKSAQKLRVNARETWWTNLDRVTADNESQATFHLKRPQPSFLALLASGLSPVYPCHVSPSEMRQHPVGTGPFKFVEFKPNQSIRVVRNSEYWKPGRPYLDGIDYTMIPNRSTAMLAFAAGQFDLTFPYEITIAMLKDLRSQMPQAVCEITPMNVSTSLSIGQKPPFDRSEVRRAVALSLDRRAFIDILGDGQGDAGTALLPAPEGQWAMPREVEPASGSRTPTREDAADPAHQSNAVANAARRLARLVSTETKGHRVLAARSGEVGLAWAAASTVSRSRSGRGAAAAAFARQRPIMSAPDIEHLTRDIDRKGVVLIGLQPSSASPTKTGAPSFRRNFSGMANWLPAETDPLAYVFSADNCPWHLKGWVNAS